MNATICKRATIGAASASVQPGAPLDVTLRSAHSLSSSALVAPHVVPLALSIVGRSLVNLSRCVLCTGRTRSSSVWVFR
jgi:hypothetical protein